MVCNLAFSRQMVNWCGIQHRRLTTTTTTVPTILNHTYLHSTLSFIHLPKPLAQFKQALSIMLRHPNPIPHHNQPPQTNHDINTEPKTRTRHTYPPTTTNNDTESYSSDSSSSREDEDEVLLDLDETAMSQLPRHLQSNMRDIQTERFIRLQVDNKHVDVNSQNQNQYSLDNHHYQQKENHRQQQWLTNMTTRLQTARPTVIPDGGFWALTSREKCDVAPWMQQEGRPTRGAEGGTGDKDRDRVHERKKPDARLTPGLGPDSDSDSGSDAEDDSTSPKSADKTNHSKHVRFQKHVPGTNVPVSSTARAYSPHLRRPRRRDTRPVRSERYYQAGGRYAGKDARGIGCGKGDGEFRRRVSLMVRAVRKRLRRKFRILRRVFGG